MGGEYPLLFNISSHTKDLIIKKSEKKNNPVRKSRGFKVESELTIKSLLSKKTLPIKKKVKIVTGIPHTNFDAENIKEYIWDYATEKGRGLVLWPMRYALSGKEKSPDPFTLASIFGKEATIERLQKANERL